MVWSTNCYRLVKASTAIIGMIFNNYDERKKRPLAEGVNGKKGNLLCQRDRKGERTPLT